MSNHDVFKHMEKLEQLKRSKNKDTKRTASIIQTDRLESLVNNMKEEWKPFDVKLERKRKEQKYDTEEISVINGGTSDTTQS